MFRAIFAILAFLGVPLFAVADQFDYYTNSVIAKAIEEKSPSLKPVKEISAGELTDAAEVLPGVSGSVLFVETNDRRFAKLLVTPARQKFGRDDTAPILPFLLIERFTTYREATERAIRAEGKNLHLYAGMVFHLDLGQSVPPQVGGDLAIRASADGKEVLVAPVKDAKLFLLTKPIPDVAPKKAPKLEIGVAFEPRFFNGTYKLFDDGRRSGELVLKVDDKGVIAGEFTSDKDGQKYEVKGRIGSPNYVIDFSIIFPRTEQLFTGRMFTGDGRAIAGTTNLQGREAGFYALRQE